MKVRVLIVNSLPICAPSRLWDRTTGRAGRPASATICVPLWQISISSQQSAVSFQPDSTSRTFFPSVTIRVHLRTKPLLQLCRPVRGCEPTTNRHQGLTGPGTTTQPRRGQRRNRFRDLSRVSRRVAHRRNVRHSPAPLSRIHVLSVFHPWPTHRKVRCRAPYRY